jgi:hypothetical protein
MLSTAVSVASFSVVLAETFGAVMLSTLIPATFVETANTVKRLAKSKADQNPPATPSDTELTGATAALDKLPGIDAIRDAIRNIAAATAEPSELNLLLPRSATIDAEFEFHGNERYSANLQAGAQINVVNITAGYSALYETSSRNKVKLHIEFSSVPVTIAP